MSLLGWFEDPPPDRSLHVYDSATGSWRSHGYPELVRLTGRAAARLRDAGVEPGDPVVLIRNGSPEFIADFFGALLLGATPSPVAPPATMRDQAVYLEHVRRIVHLVRPRAIATTPDIAAALAPHAGDAPWPCAVRTDIPDDIEPLDTPAVLPHIGVIQFSSGSTGHPRGIRVPFAALQAQTGMLYRWLRIDATDTYANWLPLHHDMGLLGLLMLPLWGASDLWTMRPDEFIRDPLAWLTRFGAGGATMTSMPPFGMAHVARRVRPDQLEGLDFGRWRGLITGSERIDVRVVDAFLDLLGPFGLDRRAITPAYGMAEATLAVTGIPITRALRSYDCDPSSLVPGATVRPAAGDAEPATLVGCGSPLPGMAARVVDEDGAEVPEDVLGEIEVGGVSLAAGYLTEQGEIPFDGVLRSGDAGFLHDGELFVVGRLGDAVKQFGRWFFAEDADRIALTHSPRPNQTVALVGTLAGRSTVAVLVAGALAAPERIGEAVARQSPGIRVLVFSVAAGAILRTTSGKPRRSFMWQGLAEGRHDHGKVWDSDGPADGASRQPDSPVPARAHG